MKKILTGIILSTLALNASAADERQVSEVVRKYSETVACQLSEGDNLKTQYKTVKIRPGYETPNGPGAVFVVHWQGDVGCAGGNGTSTPVFTVVEQPTFASVPPIVVTNYKFPDLDLVELTNLSAKNGMLLVKGITYGPSDPQHQPSKVVSYKLKLVEEEFIKQ